MKRLITLLLVMALLLSSLTSCEIIKRYLSGNGGDTDNYPPRTTITKDEWETVLNCHNYTQQSIQKDATIKITDTCYEEISKNDDRHIYGVLVGDAMIKYEYNSSTGKWEKSLPDVDLAEWQTYFTLGRATFWYELDFDSLVYNESTKSYTYKKGDEDPGEFFFENGKLITGHFKGRVITDVGTTEIVLPDFGE